MVTLDSPGSVIIKRCVPTSQPAQLKHFSFFFIEAELIFSMWIKGYVKEHKAPPKIGRFIPVMIPSALVFL